MENSFTVPIFHGISKISDIRKLLWQLSQFIQSGYNVCTNCTRKDCRRFYSSLHPSHANCAFPGRAGTFIGIRSGLCDYYVEFEIDAENNVLLNQISFIVGVNLIEERRL